MGKEKVREEVLNVILAQLLKKKGLNIVIPEVIKKSHRPDVLVNLYGIRFLIEGRKEAHKRQLFNDILRKMQEGFGEICFGLLYPPEVFNASSVEEIFENLAASKFNGKIFFWNEKGIQTINFSGKTINELVELIRSVLDIYIRNNILKEQVETIQQQIEERVNELSQEDLWFSDEELLLKLKNALGVSEDNEEES